MTLPVVVAPAAAFDIADATTAYEATRPGLGREFLHELRRARHQMERFPAGCQQVLPGIRRCLIRRFPFGVIYRSLPDRIEILALLPLSRADLRGANLRSARPHRDSGVTADAGRPCPRGFARGWRSPLATPTLCVEHVPRQAGHRLSRPLPLGAKEPLWLRTLPADGECRPRRPIASDPGACENPTATALDGRTSGCSNELAS